MDQYGNFLFVYSIRPENDYNKLKEIMLKYHPEYIIIDGKTIFANNYSKTGKNEFVRIKKNDSKFNKQRQRGTSINRIDTSFDGRKSSLTKIAS